MAEIPVERKSNKGWLWLLLVLLIIGAIIWWLLAEANEGEFDDADEVAIEQNADTMSVDETAQAGGMTIASILAAPEAHYGMDGFTGEFAVTGPLTDRGFWIEQDGSRMFALIIDQPREEPVDINQGARVSLDGGTIRDPEDIASGQIEGVPLDQGTLDAIAGQEAILLVNEDNITISEAA